MPQLFNVTTGQIEDIPDTQVEQAILSGSYGFKQGERINVVSPEGQSGTLPAEQLGEAFSRGFKFETGAQQVERQKEAEFGGREVESALTGVARGATLGLSDVALRGLGVSEERLREVQERSPWAAGTGEVAGTLLGLGKFGAVGKATKAGIATEKYLAKKMVGKSAEGTAKTLAQKIVPQVAGGAVEGMIQGAGEALSESALGRADFNAQSVLANVGLGGVIGAGAGGLFGTLEATVPKVVRSTKSALINTRQKAADLVEKAKDPLAAAIASASGKDVDSIKKFLGNYDEFAKAIDARGTREVIEKDMLDTLVDHHAKTAEMVDKGFKLARKGELEELLKTVDPRPAINRLDEILESTAKTVDDMKLESAIYSANTTRKLEKIVEELRRKRNSYTPGKTSTNEIFDTVNTYKQKLDDLARWDANLSLAPSTDRDSILKAREVLKDYRSYLEDTEVFGEAGLRTARFNQAFSRLKDATKQFNSNFSKKTKVKGRTKYEVNPGKVSQFIRDAGKTKGESRENILTEYLDASKDFIDEVENSSKFLPDTAKIDVQGARALAERVKEREAENFKNILLNNELAALERGPGANLSEIAIGTYVDPYLGAAATGFNVVKNPVRAIKVYHQITGAADKVERRIVKSAKSFYKKARESKEMIKKARPAVTEVFLTADYNETPKKKPQSVEEGFTRVSGRIARMVSDPNYMAEELTRKTEKMAVEAPEHAGQINAVVQRAVTFLDSKMPKNPAAGRTMNLAIRKWKPSSVQMAKFARYVKAVEKPLSVVDDLNDGVVSREGVEVLREIYPALYERIQQEFMDQATEVKEAIPYKQRILLSNLLGVDLDQSISTTAMLQGTYSQQPAQQPQPQKPAVRPSQTGLSKLDRNNAIKTTTQKVLERD